MQYWVLHPLCLVAGEKGQVLLQMPLDNVTVSQHAEIHGAGTEAAKWKSGIIHFDYFHEYTATTLIGTLADW